MTCESAIEAVCGKCGETFNPDDKTDLEHTQGSEGTPCGGRGVLVGQWGG